MKSLVLSSFLFFDELMISDQNIFPTPTEGSVAVFFPEFAI
jgi:hypothetical protein